MKARLLRDYRGVRVRWPDFPRAPPQVPPPRQHQPPRLHTVPRAPSPHRPHGSTTWTSATWQRRRRALGRRGRSRRAGSSSPRPPPRARRRAPSCTYVEAGPVVEESSRASIASKSWVERRREILEWAQGGEGSQGGEVAADDDVRLQVDHAGDERRQHRREICDGVYA